MRKLPFFLACILLAAMLLATQAAFAIEPEATDPPADADMSADIGVIDAEGEDVPEEDGEQPSVTPTPTPMPTAAPVVNNSFTIEAELGYDGLLILNKWSPLFVTVTNHGADFDGTLGVNVFYSLTEYDRYESPLTLAEGATKRVLLPVQPQNRQDMYAFELVKDGEIIAEQRVPTTRHAAPETMAIGLLSQEPQALTYLNHRANALDTLRGEVWLTIPLTPDTFPTTGNLMDAFAILVVDDIDVRTLSQEQQDALKAWLLKGGFVFVSGGAQAATSYPFFTEWTGLTATGLAEGEDFTQQLLNYATMKGTPVDEAVWRNELPAKGALITTADGEHGLLTRSRAGTGSIYTAAFDMGGKPLAGWASMGGFWPRMLRQSAPSEYANLLNRVESSRYGGDNEAYNAQNLITTLRIDNPESGIPVLLILAVYLVVVGIGGYLLLKRLDKREWLWVATPVAAVVFALLLFVLSRGSTMNEPVTLTASRVLVDGDSARANTYIGVATSEGGELTIETDQPQLPTVLRTDSYWYDDQSVDRLYRPVTMRQRYHFDSYPRVGFMASEAWDAKMLMLSGLQQEIGTLSVRVWMEEDGMHGEAVNNTEYHLKDCIAVTSMGYSSIGDMLPGQTVSFQMLFAKKAIDPNDPDFKIQADTMYSTLDLDPSATQFSYYYSNGIYSYLDAAIFQGREYNAYPLGQQRTTLAQLFNTEWSFYETNSSFYFFGFNDSIGQVQVSLNGKPVSRTAHTAVVGSPIAFEPIGPTGVVMFPQGTIQAETIIDQGPDEKARVANEDDVSTDDGYYNSNYLALGAPAAIRFMLPEWGIYEIERMTLLGMTYDAMPTLYLYNNETAQWDEQLLLTVSMDGEGWAPYIDDEGGVYARYVTQDESSRYGGMSMPSISLKGEVK